MFLYLFLPSFGQRLARGYSDHAASDYRARFQDPELGVFVQRDPIGIWGDGANWGNGYAYVGNDPANGMDPLGLQFEDCTTPCIDIPLYEQVTRDANSYARSFGYSRSEQNAYRHCVRACIFTQLCGPDQTASFLDCREDEQQEAPDWEGPEDRHTDEHNNQSGIDLGMDSRIDCVTACQDALKNDELDLGPRRRFRTTFQHRDTPSVLGWAYAFSPRRRLDRLSAAIAPGAGLSDTVQSFAARVLELDQHSDFPR